MPAEAVMASETQNENQKVSEEKWYFAIESKEKLLTIEKSK